MQKIADREPARRHVLRFKEGLCHYILCSLALAFGLRLFFVHPFFVQIKVSPVVSCAGSHLSLLLRCCDVSSQGTKASLSLIGVDLWSDRFSPFKSSSGPGSWCLRCFYVKTLILGSIYLGSHAPMQIANEFLRIRILLRTKKDRCVVSCCFSFISMWKSMTFVRSILLRFPLNILFSFF